MLGLVQPPLDVVVVLHTADVLLPSAGRLVVEEAHVHPLGERALHQLAVLPLASPKFFRVQPSVLIIVEGYDNFIANLLDNLHLLKRHRGTIRRHPALPASRV